MLPTQIKGRATFGVVV